MGNVDPVDGVKEFKLSSTSSIMADAFDLTRLIGGTTLLTYLAADLFFTGYQMWNPTIRKLLRRENKDSKFRVIGPISGLYKVMTTMEAYVHKKFEF